MLFTCCLLVVYLLFTCCLLVVYLFIGEIIHSMIAHQDAVTGLDVDSQGLFVITSGRLYL